MRHPRQQYLSYLCTRPRAHPSCGRQSFSPRAMWRSSPSYVDEGGGGYRTSAPYGYQDAQNATVVGTGGTFFVPVHAEHVNRFIAGEFSHWLGDRYGFPGDVGEEVHTAGLKNIIVNGLQGMVGFSSVADAATKKQKWKLSYDALMATAKKLPEGSTKRKTIAEAKRVFKNMEVADKYIREKNERKNDKTYNDHDHNLHDDDTDPHHATDDTDYRNPRKYDGIQPPRGRVENVRRNLLQPPTKSGRDVYAYPIEGSSRSQKYSSV
jgi:hypothetical protein